MIILYWMTPDPVTATEGEDLLAIHGRLHEHGVRRLPVVRGDELVGIVGRSNLLRWVAAPRLAGPLDPDVQEVLRSHTVAEAMTPDPHTCDAYDHLEIVSRRMQQLKVGAFPVLNRGHLVGMISETDIMGAVAELAYEGEEGKRITLRFPTDAPDVLYNIVDLSRRCRLELLAVLTHPILDESAVMATLRVRGPRLDDFVKSLWEAGYKVADVS